jgi:hypothetical protein
MALTEMSRRPLLAYALVGVAALVVGYCLTSPLDLTSFVSLLAVVFLLLTPLLLRWHHAVLIFAWNASIVVFFLPGTPSFWMLAALISLVCAAGRNLLVGRIPYSPARRLSMALVLLGLVVVGVGVLRGGIGMASLGSGAYGGKKYFTVLFAILGFFALAATPVPRRDALFFASLFVLSGMTAVLGHLVYAMGEHFYFFYLLFPTDLAAAQVVAEYTRADMVRLTGVSMSFLAIVEFMILRYGLEGIFNLRHPLRFLLFTGSSVLMLFSGFRSYLILLMVLFAVQFCLERLFSFRALLAGLGGAVVIGALLAGFSTHLPKVVQRSMSFLPIPIDADVRMDAAGSTEWRIRMWHALLPDLPRYVLLGKGYAIDPGELAMSDYSMRRGFSESSTRAALAGDFHNGPLSVFIPLGGPGLLVFLFFIVAALRMLYRHYRHGDPDLKLVNTFLLSVFITQLIMFTFVFGALDAQLFFFTGVAGLSVALNRNRQAAPVTESTAAAEFAPFPSWSPARRRPFAGAADS